MASFRQSVIWKTAKRLALDPGRRALANLISHGEVPLTWCLGRNWGDALSPVLTRMLSGRPVVRRVDLHYHRYLGIGSILGGANERAEVWGSGFIREGERVAGRPQAVHAVRGPLSRNALLQQGVDCPEVYGDPALLLPRFFKPPRGKRFSVGIIPHYMDKGHPWLERFTSDPEVLVIDVESGLQDFVKAVISCDVILSSSLHGLICADAYRVNRSWIVLSDRVIGGDFKFRDYRLSIGAEDLEPNRIADDSRLAKATAQAALQPLEIDLRKLLLACPFLSPELRREAESAKPVSCGLPDSLNASTVFANSLRLRDA